MTIFEPALPKLWNIDSDSVSEWIIFSLFWFFLTALAFFVVWMGVLLVIFVALFFDKDFKEVGSKLWPDAFPVYKNPKTDVDAAIGKFSTGDGRGLKSRTCKLGMSS